MEKFNNVIALTQSIVTIFAVIIGGAWTYTIFIKERHNYAHLNIEHKVSHITLSKARILLRVGLELNNAGSTRVVPRNAEVRIQQILPIAHCIQEANCLDAQLDKALTTVDATSDRFEWPLITDRVSTLVGDEEFEPGEQGILDFEFVIPAYLKVIRIYSYVTNADKTARNNDIGWKTSTYYTLDTSNEDNKK